MELAAMDTFIYLMGKFNFTFCKLSSQGKIQGKIQAYPKI